MFKKWLVIAVLLSGVVIAQCGDGILDKSKLGTYTIEGLPRDLKPEEVHLTTANNTFGLKLFKEIVLEEQDKNIFISPLSVSMALGMTYNGAAGTTEEAMRNTLEYGDLTQQEINESYRDLTGMLINLDPNVQFQIGNSIWYRLGFQVEQEFIDINQTYFDAEVTGLNFSLPSALITINNWVNQKTNGKITEIIDRIDRDHVMFLINAIYFKGNWAIQFNTGNTRDDDFYLLDRSKKTVRMMTQRNDFAYYSHQDFQAVDLPYGGQAFSMTIFLPDAGVDIDEFIAQISNESLNDWIGSFNETEINLYMPKFKLEYDLKLNDVLKALGMEIAFSGGADFTKIHTNGGIWIDEVKHKTFIDVNEEGTEAAAATVVSMIRSGPLSMTVNRPFVFIIREKFSNTILFMGKIVEPVPE